MIDNARNEYKYVIDQKDQVILEHKASNILLRDKNVGSNNYYEIRSLYFDDYYDNCFYENENGYDDREKMRIRMYNSDDSRLMFEIKRKVSNMTIKKQCPITKEQVDEILNKGGLVYKDDLHPLLKKLYIAQQTKRMIPKIIVEYDRTPYICEDGNVRITFDMNIRCSNEIHKFMDKKIDTRPFMPLYINLLEVKFDELLPDYIYDSLDIRNLKNTAFSKYFLSRKFGG